MKAHAKTSAVGILRLSISAGLVAPLFWTVGIEDAGLDLPHSGGHFSWR